VRRVDDALGPSQVASGGRLPRQRQRSRCAEAGYGLSKKGVTISGMTSSIRAGFQRGGHRA